MLTSQTREWEHTQIAAEKCIKFMESEPLSPQKLIPISMSLHCIMYRNMADLSDRVQLIDSQDGNLNSGLSH